MLTRKLSWRRQNNKSHKATGSILAPTVIDGLLAQRPPSPNPPIFPLKDPWVAKPLVSNANCEQKFIARSKAWDNKVP
jgi:hypothetical protein